MKLNYHAGESDRSSIVRACHNFEYFEYFEFTLYMEAR